MLGDIRETAAGWYALKVAKGEVPRVAVGGIADGLPFFEVEIDGRVYWLAEDALLDPPKNISSSAQRTDDAF